MNARVKGSLAAMLLLAMAGVVSWVIAGLDAFSPDTAPIGYVGQPAVSTHLLYTGADATLRTRLYANDYVATDWSGNLHSYPLSAVGAVVKTDDWTGGAQARIDAQSATSTAAVPTGRYIVTRDGSTGVAFRWSGASKISDTQKAILDPGTPLTGKTVPTTSPVLNYIRGDQTNEGAVNKDGSGGYRVRASVLGDIIHSTPLYCSATAPSPAAACGAATVFVGANDGMLHAINAATGSERFAYIPSMLIPKLAQLTQDPYTHTYYVDGRMDIRNFGGTTILAGALGAGGKGLFALDVTHADATSETNAASKILWEITNSSTGFANLGYTYGQPVLTTLTGGTDALVVANGYNNSNSYQAVLFLINPNDGTLIHEFVTSDTVSTTNRNGLSSPTLVADGSGEAAYAYAGDLNGNLWKFQLKSPWTITKLHTVDPAQSITMAPGLFEHPDGGFIVTFVTGRMLVADDALDNISTYYAYGIWDGAPVANDQLLGQLLTERTFSGSPSIRVRTASSNTPDWTPGAGHHKGWRTPLPIAGERVVGDGAFVTGAVFMFISNNPTVASIPPAPSGENWWMQISALTGGDNNAIRFDLDGSGTFSSADQVTVTVGGPLVSPVGRNMGGGRRSQLTALDAGAFNVYQSNYDKNTGDVTPTGGVGISGGHFDYDIYYYAAGSAVTVATPTGTGVTGAPLCLKTVDVNNELGQLAPTYCTTGNGFPSGYGYMTNLAPPGDPCGSKNKSNKQTITCSQYTTSTLSNGSYYKALHVHEYDDIYDVTGVNMLAASDSSFNLSNAISNQNTQFKVLVMNQYLNPAALLAVGPTATVATAVSVKDFGGLASTTATTDLEKQALLDSLTAYSRSTIGTFVFNLPKTAFQSKDWWGDGGSPRAGLIPTQTGCVNSVTAAGTSSPLGLLNERHDGAFTIQLIASNTPGSAVELNVPGDPKYGWRVKAANFTQYVLAEYTTFWHHPNGKCYGAAGWVQDPPQDDTTDAKAKARAVGSSDPIGTFGGSGGSPAPPNIISTTTQTAKNGDVTTTTTYSDGTVVIEYPDGSIKTTLPDKTVVWTIPGVDTGGVVNTSGAVNLGGVTTPPDVLGRINWRELRK